MLSLTLARVAQTKTLPWTSTGRSTLSINLSAEGKDEAAAVTFEDVETDKYLALPTQPLDLRVKLAGVLPSLLGVRLCLQED